MNKPIDSLKLSNQDWSKLQVALKKQKREPIKNVRKDGIRIDVAEGVLTLMRILVNGSHGPHFQIRCRNISRGGLGFMHGHFLHPGTAIQVIFVTPSRQGLIAEGNITRCHLIDKNIHELGVKFDDPLNLEELISMGLALPPSEYDRSIQQEHDDLAAAAEAEHGQTAPAEGSTGDPLPAKADNITGSIADAA